MNKRKRLSESSSGSSEDERPSFGESARRGFDIGAQKRGFEFAPNEETFESLAKKARKDADAGQDKARRMMAKMGYTKGVGLGKHGQGRLEPVEASKQKGRRGLGHYNDKLKEANLRWDPDEEVVSVREEIQWLENTGQPPAAKDLDNWMGIGLAKRTIDDETLFCDPSVVAQVVNSKSVFDNLDKNEMRRARTRSNPYETIRGAFFLNRAAVKMANMDKACDFMFTKPKSLEPGELLYFADVCAGPGGFSEYVLWRKRWHAKGFGFTLKESNDFKLEDFYAGPPETFHPYYGPNGDGDVYSPENQKEFRKLIMRQTRDKGVHFMMADGGFSVEGQESIQEILSKQLYLCQCLVALMIVRKGGNFVTKLFDLFTPFSAGLVYIMHRCFKRVSIFKPNTSRPANSERYLICGDKHENVDDVIEYLSRANGVLLKGDKSRDVMDLVPHEILEENTAFFDYLRNSNDNLGKKQIVGLLKIAAYCEDTTLFEHRQAEMRKQCLDYWELPDTTRTVPRNAKPDERLKSLITGSSLKFLTGTAAKLTTSNFENSLLHTPHDWFCMPCGSSGQTNDEDRAATFYMGMGRTKTFRYSRGSWLRVLNLELPPDTLVYAEMISELVGEYKKQRKTTALHILDAYYLGSEDVSQKFLQDRYELTKMFCEALWKPTNSEFIRVRAKDLYYLPDNLENKLRLKRCVMKNGTVALAHVPPNSASCRDVDVDGPYFIIPNSVLFLKGTAQNWSRHVSKTTNYPFYFNCKDNRRIYDKDKPDEANANFSESFENRILWQWPPDSALSLDKFLSLIRSKCSPPKNELPPKKELRDASMF